MFSVVRTNIDQNDGIMMLNDINFLFDTGEWYNDVPHYQTNPTLFDIPKDHWKKLKETFIQAVRITHGVEPHTVRCWAYKNLPFVQTNVTPSDQWHIHNKYGDNNYTVSGVFYLLMPHGSNGTEYKDGNEIKYMPYDDSSWTLFSGDLEHRPGYWDYKNMKMSRVVIAADAVISK